MNIAIIIISIVDVILSVVLSAIVLMQSGKESGLSGALSGKSETYMGKNGGGLDKKLTSATKWIGLVWIVLTLALGLLAQVAQTGA